MILNAFAALAMLIALIEFAGGGVLLALATHGARSRVLVGEDARHLLLLLVLLLLLLSGVSALLWLLLLQSYVPQWSGVKCVAGVLRIGTPSSGAAGWLPGLARATSWLRGAVVFGAGAGVLLHLVGRDRPEGPPGRRHLVLLSVVALLATAGAAAEVAWIVIPKTSQALAAGCCTTTPQAAAGPVSPPLGGGATRAATALFLLPALALTATIATGGSRASRTGVLRDLLTVGGAAAVLVLGLRFVNDVVSPAVLGLPLHRCVYCLVARAPETLVGLVLLAAPLFASGWRVAARRLAEGGGRSSLAVDRFLHRLSVFGLLGAVVFFAAEWGVS